MRHKQKRQLTKEDIKNLKYQCRPGFIVPFIVLVVGLFIIGIINSILTGVLEIEIAGIIEILFITVIFISLLTGYLIMRKYLIDIRIGEKEIHFMTIDQKEGYISHEAGSGTLYIGQEMKKLDIHSFIIDNTRYKVNKDFFDACKEGDEVEFHIAPKSRHRIKMKKGENTSL